MDEAMKKPPPSAWLAMTLTALGLLATVAFSLGTVVLLADPPDPGEDLRANAGLAFLLYIGMTGADDATPAAFVLGGVALVACLPQRRLELKETSGWGSDSAAHPPILP